MQLPQEQAALLRAIVAGSTLKVHRDIEGNKDYVLHALDGGATPVPAEVAAGLVEAGLLDSNKKFPAATFWLTERGQAAVGERP
ncbi:MAG: hypothetical protein IT317_11020 [Anaerolineales bacterium]|nr:hypothetical protein [Anaerolineales bacterium]